MCKGSAHGSSNSKLNQSGASYNIITNRNLAQNPLASNNNSKAPPATLMHRKSSISSLNRLSTRLERVNEETCASDQEYLKSKIESGGIQIEGGSTRNTAFIMDRTTHSRLAKLQRSQKNMGARSQRKNSYLLSQQLSNL